MPFNVYSFTLFIKPDIELKKPVLNYIGPVGEQVKVNTHGKCGAKIVTDPNIGLHSDPIDLPMIPWVPLQGYPGYFPLYFNVEGQVVEDDVLFWDGYITLYNISGAYSKKHETGIKISTFNISVTYQADLYQNLLYEIFIVALDRESYLGLDNIPQGALISFPVY